MRTRSATALSVAGVLVAGLVAAIVNTQALASSGGNANALLASTQLAASSTSGEIPVSATSSSGQTTFPVGAAGQVTVSRVNEVLQLVAATPSADWSIAAVATNDNNTITVDFVSAASTMRVTATLLDGVVTATITTVATAPMITVAIDTGPTTSAAPPTTGDSTSHDDKSDDKSHDDKSHDDKPDDD